MQEGQQVIGDSHEHVVILFSDIVGFSTMASTMSAVEVFLMLSNLYYAFDRLVDKYGVYKVETIGDGYMLAAGKLSSWQCWTGPFLTLACCYTDVYYLLLDRGKKGCIVLLQWA